MIEVEKVSKIFPGTEKPAVDKISFKVEQGNILVVVGPSGCGKTTTLRMINRLVSPTEGKIYVAGEDTDHINHDRLRKNIGYVIQQIGLFPHKTVEENVALVPKMLNWPAQKTKERVYELLELFNLNPTEIKWKYPHQLSGGQMQRIGVARALAADPPIMLMDEPFGAVDPIIRHHLQNEFLKLHKSLNKTILFITHDIDEALKMGDEIVVMNEGNIVQKDAPLELLSHPKNEFVENLVGINRGVRMLDLIAVKRLATGNKKQGEHENYLNVGKWNANNAVHISNASIGADQPVKEALETMMREDTDTLKVVEENRVVGHISWQEIKSHINKISSKMVTEDVD